ncbi:DUF4352 domain-containing protein [Gracilibacillus massiliensis]|uniref:DUF4352 domain-containing protein n=1 Tax=Gracilibacillus massiliensis TaxID=1564956 RepID=UPI00071CDA22|nr:DUF4352 domain-containing protein [Gracilibacillus massiliensis]
MKKLQFCLIGLFLSLLLIACSSDEESEQVNLEEDTSNEEVNNEETDESEEEDITEDANEESSKEEKGSTTNNEDFLSLGETGTVESNVGDYEVTVNSFEFIEEFDENTPMLKYFVLVDYTVKNIGEDPIVGEDIYRTEIIDDQEYVEENYYFESINQLKGEIAPGESVEAELLFDSEESEHYQLVFNYASSATTLTWEFNSNEVSD